MLLADDHQVVLVAAARVLAREFDDVGAVSDGQTALDETERLQPDVLVSDISMPGMSGIEAAGALGYVVKSRMASDLIDAAKAAFAGRNFVSIFPRM